MTTEEICAEIRRLNAASNHGPVSLEEYKEYLRNNVMRLVDAYEDEVAAAKQYRENWLIAEEEKEKW